MLFAFLIDLKINSEPLFYIASLGVLRASGPLLIPSDIGIGKSLLGLVAHAQ